MSETAIAQLQKQLSYRSSDGRDWCDACNCEEPLPNHTDDCPFTALRAQKPSEPAVSFCPECGFNVECDEDGCCVTCGATAMGEAVRSLRVFSAQWRQAPTEEADDGK